MMDINNLLNQFFAGQSSGQFPTPQESEPTTSNAWADTAKNIVNHATQGGLGGFAGGAATGGLLALLLTSKKARNIAGGALGYGGAAALGAMAMKAYQNYQSGSSNASVPHHVSNGSSLQGASFGVILIKSMVMASKVDGHVDAEEQQRIFSALEKSNLSAEEKGVILDALSKPIDMHTITQHTYTPEQAGQLYLASRVAIDPDQPVEKEYLSKLADGLKLPPALVSELENQIVKN